MRLDDRPPVGSRQIADTFRRHHSPNLPQMGQLSVPVTDVLDHMVAEHDVEAVIVVRQLRAVDESELVAIGDDPLIDDVDGGHSKLDVGVSGEVVGDDAGAGADLEQPERSLAWEWPEEPVDLPGFETSRLHVERGMRLTIL